MADLISLLKLFMEPVPEKSRHQRLGEAATLAEAASMILLGLERRCCKKAILHIQSLESLAKSSSFSIAQHSTDHAYRVIEQTAKKMRADIDIVLRSNQLRNCRSRIELHQMEAELFAKVCIRLKQHYQEADYNLSVRKTQRNIS